MEPKYGLVVNESSEAINIYCTFNANPPGLITERTVSRQMHNMRGSIETQRLCPQKWFKDGRELKPKNLRGHITASFTGYPILTINNVIREGTPATVADSVLAERG